MSLRILDLSRLIYFLVAFFLSLPTFGQMPVHEIPRLSTPIEFDGKVSEGEWNATDSLPLVSHWPTY